MEIKYLQVLVMPNNEILYKGKTLGFIGDGEKSIEVKHLITEDKIIKDVVKGNNKSIRIPISTNDAEELRDGAVFEWSFPVEGSASSEWIDVELVGTDEEVM